MDTQEKKVAAFLERLSERLSDKVGASRSGVHRAAFTALRPFIDGSLARGYTMKTTWTALREEKKLSMTYETFRAHCRRVGIGGRSGAMSSPEEAPRVFRHRRAPRRGDLN
jgi:hypothetical protein